MFALIKRVMKIAPRIKPPSHSEVIESAVQYIRTDAADRAPGSNFTVRLIDLPPVARRPTTFELERISDKLERYGIKTRNSLGSTLDFRKQ